MTLAPEELEASERSPVDIAEGRAERLADLAVELVQLKPDVIFAYGGDVAPLAKKATATIPIVFVVGFDPVAAGLVASLGRPGGNATGMS